MLSHWTKTNLKLLLAQKKHFVRGQKWLAHKIAHTFLIKILPNSGIGFVSRYTIIRSSFGDNIA